MERSIVEALYGCRMGLLVLSHGCIRSPRCIHELLVLLHRGLDPEDGIVRLVSAVAGGAERADKMAPFGDPGVQALFLKNDRSLNQADLTFVDPVEFVLRGVVAAVRDAL